MRDAHQLRRDARRAYERGRLRAALRVGFVIAPVAALCAWETGALWSTIVLAAGLWIVTTLLRWRQRHGFQIVAAGLRSGAVPLAAALALCRFAPACPPAVGLALCGTTGLISGGLLGRRLSMMILVPWQQWIGAAVVAGVMATLGCLALGIGSAVGAGAGITVGAAVVVLLPRRAAL